jgi:hypothetical protein
MRRLILYSMLFAFGHLARAQEPKITARTDSVQYKVGQWILMDLEARLPQGVDSLVLAAKDSLGSLEILDSQAFPATNGTQRWSLRLASFDTGMVFIPPVPFVYKTAGDSILQTAHANPIPLTIVGIPFDPKGDIKDIKPPLDAPWRFEDFLPYLIALVIVALLVFMYRYYKKVKRSREASYVPPKPTIPPWRVALAALHTLEDQRLWQQGRVKEFYSGVTEILRRFLEDQYAVLALESTSEEILQQLKRLPEAQPNMADFRSFFTTADLVKFAKYLPAPEENQRELTWGFQFVRSMTPHPASTPAGVAPQTPDQAKQREVEHVR